MSSELLVVARAITILTAGLAAQSSRPASWMPLEVGSYWEYETPAHTKVTFECVWCETFAGERWFTIERCAGDLPGVLHPVIREKWMCRADGLHRRVSEPDDTEGQLLWEEPVCMIAFPLGVHARWDTCDAVPPLESQPCGTPPMKYEFRAELQGVGERIVTAAGTFSTARIDSSVTREGQLIRTVSAAFAQGVGLVKLVELGPVEPSGTLTLTRYVPAGAPVDADLAALVARALEADPHLKARGAPRRLDQIRNPSVRHTFKSRLCRVEWASDSVLFRELSAVVCELDPTIAGHWDRFFAAEGLRMDGSSRDSVTKEVLMSMHGLVRARFFPEALVPLLPLGTKGRAGVHHTSSHGIDGVRSTLTAEVSGGRILVMNLISDPEHIGVQSVTLR